MDNKNKVIDFNEALKQQNEKECEHEHSCPHCDFVNAAVENFTSRLQNVNIGSDQFTEEVKDLIGYVELITRRNTLAEIAGGLIEEIEYIDGKDEE